jgi:hypothetical protein
MNRFTAFSFKNFRLLSIGIFVILLGGVSYAFWKNAFETRAEGIVRIHVDEYQSGTGSSADLVRDNQMGGGFDYRDTKKSDWRMSVEWRWIARLGGSDLYRFKWCSALEEEEGVSVSRMIRYNGKQSVIVLQDANKVISIEPGSIPLPQMPDEIFRAPQLSLASSQTAQK